MKLLRNYLLFCAYAILVTPLLFVVELHASYIFTQVLFFKIIIGSSVLPLFIFLLYAPSHRPRLNLKFAALSLFGLSLLVLNVWSVDPIASYAGSWERFGGVIDWLYIYGFLFLLITVVRTRAHWISYFRASEVVAVIVSVYGWMQFTGTFNVFRSGERLFSTLGNPAFLAAYLLLALGISSYLFLNDKKSLRWWHASAIVLQVPIMYLTYTRAAFFAMILLFLAVIVYTIVTYRKKLPSIKIAGQGWYGILLFVLFVVLIGFAISSTSVSNSSRLFGKGLLGLSVQSRFVTWEIALKGFVERPVFGWGDTNYLIIFQEKYDSRLYLGIDQSTFFDKPHNELLDRLVETGLAGTICYLLFLFFPALVNVRKRKEGDSGFIILTFFSLAYAVYLFFSFHSIGDTMLFTLYLAFVYHFFSKDTELPVQNVHSFFASSIILLSIGAVILLQLPTIAANYSIRKAEACSSIECKIPLLDDAWPLSLRGQQTIANSLSEVLYDSVVVHAQEMIYYEKARRWFEAVRAQHPSDLRYIRALAQIYRNAGLFDPERLFQALDLTDVLRKLSPYDPRVYQAAGFLHLQLSTIVPPDMRSAYRAAVAQDFETVYALAPSLTESIIFHYIAQFILDPTSKELMRYVESHYEEFSYADWKILTDSMFLLQDKKSLEMIGRYSASLDSREYPFSNSVQFLIGDFLRAL